MQLSQTDRNAGSDYYLYAEIIFTLIFVVEWTLRMVGNGWTMIFDKFNAFDTFLVIGCGLIPLLLIWYGYDGIDQSTIRT